MAAMLTGQISADVAPEVNPGNLLHVDDKSCK